MKKRFGLLLSVVALGMALMTPTATFAASKYTFKIVTQYCESGGHGHNPFVEFKVTAAGTSSANKLTIKSTSQYFAGGSWHNSYHWKANKSTFTPNGTAHSLDYDYDHYFPSDTRKWRIVAKLKALHNSTVLASKTLKGMAC